MADHDPAYHDEDFTPSDTGVTEVRTHWTCSCGRTNADGGHQGGYASLSRAEDGFRLHVQRVRR